MTVRSTAARRRTAKERDSIIGPGVTELDHGGSLVVRAAGEGLFLVRGCPCYKEFGDEKVCVNNDDLISINAISVDPTFFAQAKSSDQLLGYKSDKEGMCYLLISLDEGQDSVFCLSRGMRLVINRRTVRASDLDAALRFLSLTGASASEEICSECLYKYLVTLSDVFDDVVSEEEKAEVIISYVKTLAIELVAELEGGCDITIEDYAQCKDLLSRHIETIRKAKAELSKLIDELKQSGVDEDLIRLVDHYKQLCRLESIFLFQVETLFDAADEIVALGLLRYMIAIAERVLRLNDSIRERTRRLQEAGLLTKEISFSLASHAEKKRLTEQRFRNLMRVLSQIDVMTGQQRL